MIFEPHSNHAMGLFVYLCIYKQKQVECSFKRQIMNNVLIITTNLRHVSNSDALAEAFTKGAAEAGNEMETVTRKGTSTC